MEAFSPLCEVVDTHSLDEAIEACREHAVPGDAVLLSPCCASFDLFKNYEQRGELLSRIRQEDYRIRGYV